LELFLLSFLRKSKGEKPIDTKKLIAKIEGILAGG